LFYVKGQLRVWEKQPRNCLGSFGADGLKSSKKKAGMAHFLPKNYLTNSGVLKAGETCKKSV